MNQTQEAQVVNLLYSAVALLKEARPFVERDLERQIDEFLKPAIAALLEHQKC